MTTPTVAEVREALADQRALAGANNPAAFQHRYDSLIARLDPDMQVIVARDVVMFESREALVGAVAEALCGFECYHLPGHVELHARQGAAIVDRMLPPGSEG